jgi:hypothetical protein
MKHLSESFLNQYLDRALSADELHRIETHLNGCPICSARLEQLHSLSSALKAYQDEPLGQDLTPSILRRLPEQRSPVVFRVLLVAQAGISVGLVALLLTTFDHSDSFQSQIDRFFAHWQVVILPANPLPWPTWTAAIQGLTDRFLSVPEGVMRWITLLNLGSLLAIPGPNLLLAGLAVSVLWILGNTLLLAHRMELRK